MVEASPATVSFAIISMLPAMPSIVIAMPVTAAVVGTTIMITVPVAAAALDTANNPTGHFTTFIVLDLYRSRLARHISNRKRRGAGDKTRSAESSHEQCIFDIH